MKEITYIENGVQVIRQILDKPMKIRQLIDSNRNGIVEAVVRIELNELIECDFESFLDTLSEKVTGSDCGLENISYEAVGVVDGAVAIHVAGDVSRFLEGELEEQSD